MNITYTQNGDDLIPNIIIRKTKPLGHYGRLRKAYLEMHQMCIRDRYENIFQYDSKYMSRSMSADEERRFSELYDLYCRDMACLLYTSHQMKMLVVMVLMELC